MLPAKADEAEAHKANEAANEADTKSNEANEAIVD
jgi:hypothetical protein